MCCVAQAHGKATDVRGESDRLVTHQQRARGRRWVVRVSGEQHVRPRPAAGAAVRPRTAGQAQRLAGDRRDQHDDKRPVGPQQRSDVQVHRTAQKVRRYVNENDFHGRVMGKV